MDQYDDEKANLAAEICNRETGYITIQVLRDQVRRNPTNRDDYEIQAECIAGSGLVASSFSGAQLKEAELKFRESQPKSEMVFSDPSPHPGQVITISGDLEAVGSVADFIAFTDPTKGDEIYRRCQRDPLGLLAEK